MTPIKSFLFILIFLFSSTSLFAQLVGYTKDKKYLIASFKSLGTEELETIGTIFEARMYFRLDSTTRQLTMYLEHKINPEFIVAKLIFNDKVDLFENQKDPTKLDYIDFTNFDVDFIKSPWEKLGLKKGYFQFTSINENPRRFLAYLYLNLPDHRSIRITGYVEDDLIEMQQKMEEKKSIKKNK